MRCPSPLREKGRGGRHAIEWESNQRGPIATIRAHECLVRGASLRLASTVKPINGGVGGEGSRKYHDECLSSVREHSHQQQGKTKKWKAHGLSNKLKTRRGVEPPNQEGSEKREEKRREEKRREEKRREEETLSLTVDTKNMDYGLIAWWHPRWENDAIGDRSEVSFFFLICAQRINAFVQAISIFT